MASQFHQIANLLEKVSEWKSAFFVAQGKIDVRCIYWYGAARKYMR